MGWKTTKGRLSLSKPSSEGEKADLERCNEPERCTVLSMPPRCTLHKRVLPVRTSPPGPRARNELRAISLRHKLSNELVEGTKRINLPVTGLYPARRVECHSSHSNGVCSWISGTGKPCPWRGPDRPNLLPAVVDTVSMVEQARRGCASAGNTVQGIQSRGRSRRQSLNKSLDQQPKVAL